MIAGMTVETGLGSAVSKGRVLIVDDQFLIVEFLRIWAEAHGFETCATASTAAGAVEMAVLHKPDCILMDVRLEGDRPAKAGHVDIDLPVGPLVLLARPAPACFVPFGLGGVGDQPDEQAVVLHFSRAITAPAR